MSIAKEQSVEYRYERKFVVTELVEQEIMTCIRLHPAMFSEIYAARNVNNIYLDTEAADSYFDNVEGSGHRVKCRLRWYGALFGMIEKPVLEFKVKHGLVGRKLQFAVVPFRIEASTDMAAVRNALAESAFPDQARLFLRTLEPTLMNQYRRRYFQSDDKAFRITVDTDMSFYRIGRHDNTFLNSVTDYNSCVVELKYDRELEEEARHISGHFGFRAMKNSKYVTGIEYLRDF